MNMFANRVVFVVENEVVWSKDKAHECYYDGGSYTFVLFLVHCFLGLVDLHHSEYLYTVL